MSADKIIRLPHVKVITGLSRSTIYALIAQNSFPRPIQLSRRAVGWKHSEVMAWIESRSIAGCRG